MVLILNHTSLLEFIFGVSLPFSYLREIANRLVIAVADKTLNRPIAGYFFARLAPKVVSLTRKRDQSWTQFLDSISSDNICIFLPEGQMKRENNLDKNGKEMKVKLGAYDLLRKYRGKNMVIAYSDGLHHVLPPSRKIPSLFKKISVGYEYLEVSEYLSRFEDEKYPARAMAMDLQKRRDTYCEKPHVLKSVPI